MYAFDRSLKRTHRDRIAVLPNAKDYDALKEHVATVVAERLDDVMKERTFRRVLDIGSGSGLLLPHLAGRAGIREVTLVESSAALLHRDERQHKDLIKSGALDAVHYVVADEEAYEPAEGTFDLVVSSLSMHWVNDLPGMLLRMRKALRPDGLFIGSMFGGESLPELRIALQVAELEREGGVSSHVSPFASSQDMAALLNVAGFKLTAVERDEMRATFTDMFSLIDDLRGMGEANATVARRAFTPRDTFAAAAAVYKEIYGLVDDSSGERVIPASFEVLYLSGWSPHSSQPKASRRGSATASLKDIDSLPNPLLINKGTFTEGI